MYLLPKANLDIFFCFACVFLVTFLPFEYTFTVSLPLFRDRSNVCSPKWSHSAIL